MDDQEELDLLPVRMVNEYVYCPRLFWLEYVEREFVHSYDTVDGERVHRRVDRPKGVLTDDASKIRLEATAVELSSPRLGIVGKIDVVRGEDRVVWPVDFKRGVAPPRGPYDPERVQVALQALLLREHGYQVDSAQIYYAASKALVDVVIDEELEALAIGAIAGAREIAARTLIPRPLVNSPKCGRCSLHAVCLPDETNALATHDKAAEIRPFVAESHDTVPLYILEGGTRVGISGEVIQVRDDEGIKAEAPLIEIASISLFGNVQISSQALRAVLGRDIPVFVLSYGGWLNGFARSVNDHSLDLRIAQHRIVGDAEACLRIARNMIAGKVKNQRTMIRRSLGSTAAKSHLQSLSLLLHRIDRARTAPELLGLEGAAAATYFAAFAEMLNVGTGFEITGRNRRPPTDPINALLSFGYSMLAKEATAAAISVGFEPGLGIYHRVRPGRPSLALDLMEEFRSLIVDSTVLGVINSRELRASHCDRRGMAVVLTDDGRRTFIRAIERRLRSNIMHPIFGYVVTYRRAIHVQARLLARAVQGDIESYPAFVTR